MNTRNITRLAFFFAIVGFLFAASALAEKTADGLVYEVSGGNASIVGYEGTAETVVIPSTLGGATVTAIGEKAFRDNKTITKVEMPSTLRVIGLEAFRGCENLVTADIPSGVTGIKERAFFHCVSLKETDVPAGVAEIEGSAYYGCSALSKVTLHKGLKVIGYQAFGFLDALESIDIPDSVTMIQYSAFISCSNLTSIDLSENLTTIGESAFCYCTSLKQIDLPDGVTTIAVNAFGSCYALTSIEIPDGVTRLEMNTFYDCRALTSVKLPAKLKFVNNWAIIKCDQLKYLVLPKDATDLYYASFPKSMHLYVYKGSKSASKAKKYWDTTEISFALNDSTCTVNIGGASQLSATYKFIPGQDKIVYKSADSTIATVDDRGTVKGVKAGKVTITAYLQLAPGLKSTCAVTVTNKAETPIEAIALNLAGITIAKGQSVNTVVARVTPSNADVSSLSWVSSDTAVAKVSSSGKVTGVGKGTATITVQSGNSDAAAQFSVTVVAKGKGVTAAKFKSSTVTLRQGLTKKLTLTLSPKSPADSTVVYKSTDESVATVDASGKVTAVSVGSAKIVATTSSGVSAKCKIVVTSNYVTKISPAKSKLSIVLKAGETFGKTAQITCSVSPEDALDPSVTYKSSDEAVCTVDANGLVTSVGFGKATVVVRAADGGGAKAKIEITVAQKLVKSLSITGAKKMKVDETQQLSVDVQPTSAYNQEIKWISSNEEIATVDENGIVTAHKKGTVKITAKARDGSKVKATFQITVK